VERLAAAEREGLAAKTSLSEQRKVLEQERRRAEGLTRELASARESLREQQSALEQERKQRMALVGELGSARQQVQNEVRAAGASVIDQRKRFEQEHARESLERELALSRQAAAQQENVIQQERKRAESLASELASARQKVEQLAAGQEEARVANASHQKLLEQERQKAEGLMRELASARDTSRQQQAAREGGRPVERTRRASSAPDQVEAPVQAATTGAAITAVAARTVEGSEVRAGPVAEPSALAKVMARAEQLLLEHNIGAARLLLERAAKGGNVRAVFLLAETYDPRVLADRNIFGVSGDHAKARELYLRASASGVPEAQKRSNEMAASR
jgi:TPR repeat protein